MNTYLKYFFAIALSLMSFAFSFAQNENATIDIHNVWLEHNVTKKIGPYNQSAKGLEIHSYFDISGYKGKTLCVIAYFAYKEDYTPLRSRTGNNTYRTRDNQVCTGGYAYVKYEPTCWDDYILFIPYYEFSRALSESTELVCILQIQTQSGVTLAYSEPISFDFNKY